MKLRLACAAIAVFVVPMPAKAASILLDINVQAQGSTTNTNCGLEGSTCVPTTTPVVRTFRFQQSFDTAEFVDGLATFRFGLVRANGAFSGTILSLGPETFAGRDFSFLQSLNDMETTRLAAAIFSVAQVSPSPVPEPATWAMMLIGFGAVGYSMRGREHRLVSA